MQLDLRRLDTMSRADLIAEARAVGADRAERMTRAELKDEVVRLTATSDAERSRSRGWLGVARDLVAGVVDAGLNLPGAAKAIRGDGARLDVGKRRPPVATVTLAEIYATQGHKKRALGMLDQVLAREPDHEVARSLRGAIGGEPAREVESARVLDVPPAKPEMESAPSPAPELGELQTLLVRHGEKGTAVAWQIAAGELTPADPDARWVIKLVGFVAGLEGVESKEFEFEFEEEQARGLRFVPNLAECTEVRAVLALSSPSGFFPSLVASNFGPQGLEFCPRPGAGSVPAESVAELEQTYQEG